MAAQAGLIAMARSTAERAAAASDYLNGKGIIVRPVGGYGLPHCLRITVGTGDQIRRLIGALETIVGRRAG